MLVQRERAVVALLSVHHGSLDSTALHPPQPVDGEVASEPVTLMIGIDGETL